MSRCLNLAALATAAIFVSAAPLAAQTRTAVTPADLDAAVATQSTDHRQVIRDYLATEPARQAASRLGASSADLAARVAGLDQASAERIAARINAADPVLAGGRSTVVISTTAIIIALLILILITD